jgi:hypothetical protein
VDTRTKIVTTTEATHLAMNGATVVSGFFDPVLAAHAERLAELKRPGSSLLILIATPSAPILPARARAELVAGLGIVDHVCDTDAIPAPGRHHLEAEDDARLAALIEHVHARQRAES